MTGDERSVAADLGAASPTIRETAAAINSADIEEIRALFLRQAAGETVHDIELIDAVLAHAPPGQPDPVNYLHLPLPRVHLINGDRS
jgi:hypothetical protein